MCLLVVFRYCLHICALQKETQSGDACYSDREGQLCVKGDQRILRQNMDFAFACSDDWIELNKQTKKMVSSVRYLAGSARAHVKIRESRAERWLCSCRELGTWPCPLQVIFPKCLGCTLGKSIDADLFAYHANPFHSLLRPAYCFLNIYS